MKNYIFLIAICFSFSNLESFSQIAPNGYRPYDYVQNGEMEKGYREPRCINGDNKEDVGVDCHYWDQTNRMWGRMFPTNWLTHNQTGIIGTFASPDWVGPNCFDPTPKATHAQQLKAPFENTRFLYGSGDPKGNSTNKAYHECLQEGLRESLKPAQEYTIRFKAANSFDSHNTDEDDTETFVCRIFLSSKSREWSLTNNGVDNQQLELHGATFYKNSMVRDSLYSYERHFITPPHYDELGFLTLVPELGACSWDGIEIYKGGCGTPTYIDDHHFIVDEAPFVASDIYIGMDTNHPVIVDPHVKLVLNATRSITWGPGFLPHDSAEVIEIIGPCGTGCDHLEVEAGSDDRQCSGGPIQLGEIFEHPKDATNEVTYKWHADPLEMVDFLNQDDIRNPVFTPPTTGKGSVTFTFIKTNKCGATKQDEVTVHYENPIPSPNIPSLVLSNIDKTGEYLKFDAALDPNTVSIEIYAYRDGNLEKSVDYYYLNFDTIDPNDPDIHYILNGKYYNACSVFDFKVVAKNYCNDSQEAVEWINWDKEASIPANRPVINNVVTPNGDGFDDKLYWIGDGYSTYNIFVFTPSGPLEYEEYNVVVEKDLDGKIWTNWEGQCEDWLWGPGNCSDGPYYVIIQGITCDGTIIDNAREVLLVMPNNKKGFEENEVSTSVNEFNVYPNPSNGVINISIPGGIEDQGTLNVYTLTGAVVYTEKVYSGLKTIDLSSFTKGTYILHFSNATDSFVRKIEVN